MQTWLIPPTLRGYRRSWLGPDVLAGLTLAAIAVPEQMATARLAGMPAVAGLYAFLAGSVLFAVLGRSGQMSVGADSTIAPVLAAGVAELAAAGTPRYAHLVSFLALMAGALLIAVGLLRLGWIGEFLSTPVVTGVLAGIAVQILVRQLPAILGLPVGGTTTAGRVQKVAGQIGHANLWFAGIAVAVFAVILVAGASRSPHSRCAHRPTRIGPGGRRGRAPVPRRAGAWPHTGRPAVLCRPLGLLG